MRDGAQVNRNFCICSEASKPGGVGYRMLAHARITSSATDARPYSRRGARLYSRERETSYESLKLS
jgi:hypothetical protein